jgi:hypothetical protein
MFALEAGYDLGALALCFVALALLLLAKSAVDQIVGVLNVGIFGAHPFGGIARTMENTVLRVLNDAIKGVEKGTAKFESGLLDSLGVLLAIPLLLAYGVKAALEYLWSHALGPFVHNIADVAKGVADKAWSHVQTLEGTVATNVGKAEDYADGAAAHALSTAKTYADKWIDNAVSVLNSNIRAGVAEAEGFASTAVGKLRTAEDAAIDTAVSLANAANAAGIAASAGALATAEHEIAAASAAALGAAAGALTTAEDFAARQAAAVRADALAAAAGVEAAVTGSLDVVRSIAIGAENELKDLEGIYGALGTATLIASIPALATIVHAIASEAGLENQSCRSKVKDICRTDPSAWEDLLGGLVALGFVFSLPELVKIATPMAEGLAAVVREAA